jgi:TonB-dependent Receptor Plug Domain.
VTGIGFDRNKVPAMAQTVTAEDFSRVHSPNVLDTLQQRIPGVITTDVQGNGFFQGLRYRGFAASPLQGTPQGLAVYMQGVRINEAFGDTVNWDLIPTVAIGRADIWTNNPAFGLNARRRGQPADEGRLQLQRFEFDASGAPTGASAAPCSMACAAANGVSISPPRASRTMDGATSRRRGSRASTAIWLEGD